MTKEKIHKEIVDVIEVLVMLSIYQVQNKDRVEMIEEIVDNLA
ncbi:hypothetical protein [Serpentinicella alkaliphila]|nr:hypothetical protein [Serpentinicella alkaliphila]